MDNECRDAFYSEEYFGILVEYEGSGELVKEEYNSNCFYPISYRFAVIFLTQGEGEKVPYETMPFSVIPKCFGLMDMEALEEMGILRVRRSSLDLTGSGVLIGMVDTGIDYRNPMFRYEDGRSKIRSIWDQTERSESPPEGFYYGSEYGREQIEEALRSEDPLAIVPSMDRNGHGTFLAGVAAGRVDEEEGFSGAAPDAELVVVKLKEAKKNLRDFNFLPESAIAYSEVDIMMGLSYLGEIARREAKPIVICIGLGSNQGSHIGTTYLSDYINWLALRRGIVIVVAAGNEGNASHHYHGIIRNTRETVELKVGPRERGFAMELWGKAPNRFQIQIESPTGQMTEWIEAGIRGSRSYTFLLERSQLYVDYLVVDPYSGDQGILFRFASPAEGIWKIAVAEPGSGEKEYDMWLPISGFVGEGTYFLQANPFTTITAPGNAGNPLTMSAYRQDNGALYLESSRGFTRNHLVKPELAAPGVAVKGPLLRNQFGTMSGTSVSAALTAGMAAVFLQWAVIERNDFLINTVGTKNYFIRGANRSEDRSYPNREWGYGKVDLFGVFLEIR